MKFFKCGKIAADGCKSYLRKTYEKTPDEYEELSEIETTKNIEVDVKLVCQSLKNN